MTLRLAVDFDSNDWCALYALTTDQPNQFRFETAGLEAAANISAYARALSSGSATDVLFERYSNDRAKYGKGYVSWTPSATVSQQIYIGTNLAGTDNGHSVAAGNVISVAVWMRRASGSAADTWRIVTYNITDGSGAASSAVALTTTWQKFTVSFTTTGATSQHALIMQRMTGTSTTAVHLTGAMLVNGSTIPAYYNSGPDSLLEPITDYWMGGKWGLGFVKPYQYVAPVGKADLKLNNEDKRFSPENASGAYFGSLLPNLLVQIGDPVYDIWWTGWTDGWAPEAGEFRETNAVLTATDARRFLDKPMPFQPLQESTAADDIVSNLLLPAFVPMPNTSLGIPAGSETVGWDAAPTETVAYYGDGNDEKDPVSKIIADVVGGVQGKFWMNRYGQYRFTASQGDDTPASSVNIAKSWLNMGYVTGMIVNDSRAKIYIRKADTTITLWELDETIALGVGEQEEIRVYFRNSTDDKITVGARQTGLSISHTASGASTTSILSGIGAQSAVAEFNNLAGVSRTILTASVVGTRIVAKKTIEKSYDDSASQALHGLQTETLDFNWVSSRLWAKRLVRYRVNRFKDARNEVPWVDMDVNQNVDVNLCWIGAAVRIVDDQTEHEDYYAVIGETHLVREGLTDHTAKLYLEPLYPTTVASTSV